MQVSRLLAIAFAAIASAALAAPAWKVEPAEIAYLLWGEPGKEFLSITCGQQEGETGKDETRIEVEVEAGAKPGSKPAVLVVQHAGGRQDIPLKALICGGLSECANQPDGKIYRYEASVLGKELALDIAENAQGLSIDAPGAKFSAAADAESFKKFAALCRNW